MYSVSRTRGNVLWQLLDTGLLYLVLKQKPLLRNGTMILYIIMQLSNHMT